MNFENWLVSIGKSPKTARNYAGAVAGVLSNWAVENNLVEQSLDELTSVEAFRRVCEGIRKLPIYETRNTLGKGMYSAALNMYTDYLADITQSDLEHDVSQIVDDTALSNTEKSALINTRLGQGTFRKKLIEHWRGCAVTGYSDTRFLVASHIKPWAKSTGKERLDPFNGLLLLPNLDKVFDLGYISFYASGVIRISSELEESNTLGIHSKLKMTLQAEHQVYLEYHNDKVFRR
ncbi:MAG: HNH endonuclease [Halioglobus sp.]